MDRSLTETHGQPRPGRQRWYRISIRTLLIVTLLVGLCLAAYVRVRQSAQRQAALVRRLEKAGAVIEYDFEYDRDWREEPVSPYPTWLVDWLGKDAVHHPRSLAMPTGMNMQLNRFDDQLFREALTAGPQWWSLVLNSKRMSPQDLEIIAQQSELRRLRFFNVTWVKPDLRPLTRMQKLNFLSFELATLAECNLRPIGDCKALETLYISGVSSAQLAQIPHCEKVRRLLVSELISDGDDWRWLNSFSNLEELLMFEAEMGSNDVSHLAELSKLKSLMLHIETSDPELKLRALPAGLERLEISGAPVKSFDWLTELPELRHLNLGGEKISAEDLRDATWPQSLQSLELLEINVDEVILRRLEALPSLATLRLTKSRVDPMEIAEFQKRRPDCEVALTW
jgi:hypothetical protein